MTPVRILILTDDDGSFTQGHRFGLTELVETLRGVSWPMSRFVVTTAHRAPRAAQVSASGPYPEHADLAGFDFATHFAAGGFDEIWFFGVANDNPDTGRSYPLRNDELDIVARFMQAGGGVFATGDHEDLGYLLCGRIPRVRSMRRWHFDRAKVSGPQGYDRYDESSGDAPPVMGPFRHDTLEPGHDANLSFDDQSDDVPQTIRLRWYVGGLGPVMTWGYPHPLLCSSRGPITVLPDHMHEGQVEEPADLTATFTLDGKALEEYPSLPGHPAWRVSPQVIAWGSVQPGRNSSIDRKDTFGGAFGDVTAYDQSPFTATPATFGDTFGAIAAYDGHLAEIGRVAVDSTFHHFFDVNVIGSGSNSADPLKRQGFPASPSGREAYDQIRQYWVNLADWLAPARVQVAMLTEVVWAARWDGRLRMSVSPDLLDRLAYADHLRLGAAVRSVMAQLFPPCAHVSWTLAAIDPLSLLLAPWVYLKLHAPDPPPDPLRRETLFDPQEIVTAALAGAMIELLRAHPTSTGERPQAEQVAEALTPLIGRGLRAGVARAVEAIAERLDSTRVGLDQVAGAVQG